MDQPAAAQVRELTERMVKKASTVFPGDSPARAMTRFISESIDGQQLYSELRRTQEQAGGGMRVVGVETSKSAGPYLGDSGERALRRLAQAFADAHGTTVERGYVEALSTAEGQRLAGRHLDPLRRSTLRRTSAAFAKAEEPDAEDAEDEEPARGPRPEHQIAGAMGILAKHRDRLSTAHRLRLGELAGAPASTPAPVSKAMKPGESRLPALVRLAKNASGETADRIIDEITTIITSATSDVLHGYHFELQRLEQELGAA